MKYKEYRPEFIERISDPDRKGNSIIQRIAVEDLQDKEIAMYAEHLKKSFIAHAESRTKRTPKERKGNLIAFVSAEAQQMDLYDNNKKV